MRLYRFTIFILFLAGAGCMDELHNYDTCVDIETARCDLRHRCDPTFDNQTCVTYYKEFCRTRKITGYGDKDVTDAMVDACVGAITNINCDIFVQNGMGFDETLNLDACNFIQGVDTDTTADDTSTITPLDGGII